MNCNDIITELKARANPDAVAGMARYGINTHNAYGVSIPNLRQIARRAGKKQHDLALCLWETGIHEARILAGMIDDPAQVTDEQLEHWVRDIDSWDVCDQCCSNLFDKTPFAYQKATEWTTRSEEFIKRAGFVLIASLSVHDKQADDTMFEQFFAIIQREATDERNFVKKAVNWALRQIGKRNLALNKRATEVAQQMRQSDSRVTRWIASDALRELTSEKVQAKLQ